MSTLARALTVTYKAALVLAGVPLVVAAQQFPGVPVEGEVTLPRQSAMELLSQMETVQTELRELRNQVELQKHELERLNTRQRELLQDIDRRLSVLERGAMRTGPPQVGQPPPTTTGTPPPTTPGTPPPVVARPPPVPKGTATAQEQQEYDAAFNLLKQGLYTRASQAFRAFIDKYPTSVLAGNAQYWTAEANYVVRNFGRALEEFNKVVNNYPDSPKVADALLKIGYSYYELRTWDKARQALTRVVERFPNTTVAKLAQIRLAKMKEEGH